MGQVYVSIVSGAGVVILLIVTLVGAVVGGIVLKSNPQPEEKREMMFLAIGGSISSGVFLMDLLLLIWGSRSRRRCAVRRSFRAAHAYSFLLSFTDLSEYRSR
jgi:hypothetical protein